MQTEADWKLAARNGDYIGAVRIRRAVRGESLTEAREGVDAYVKTLPTEDILPRMSDGRAYELLSKYESGLFDGLFDPRTEQQELRNAVDYIKNLLQRRMATDAGARTGPVPPNELIELAGHHWLEQLDEAGRSFGLHVLQWQPGRKAWCHSGQIATGNSIDTRDWVYVAPCPVPPLRSA